MGELSVTGPYNPHPTTSSTFDSLLQQQPELLAFLIHALPELRKLVLDRAQAVGQMETRQHRYPKGIGIGGLLGNGRHQLIDAVGKLLDFLLAAGRTKSVGLVKDRDLDAMFVAHWRSDQPALKVSICPSNRSIRPRTCLRSSRSVWIS
jgi:hypothetical protein